MKKLIPLLLVVVVMLLALSFFAPAYAQEAAKEEKPTFYHLVPGTYVNGWPRFTMSYPKDWIEHRHGYSEYFRATAPGPDPFPALGLCMACSGSFIMPNFDFDKWAGNNVTMIKRIGTDVTVLSDKRSQLRDGTPVQEVEIQAVVNGAPFYAMAFAVKKGDLWIVGDVFSRKGRIGEDLKAILYSIEFEPGKDELVKVPPDVQEFLDEYCSAWVSSDLAKLMSLYSERYLQSGTRKGEMERTWRQYMAYLGSVTSCEVGITEFVPAGDRAYLTGFGKSNIGKWMLWETSIIKENGEWKWYGNQRDPPP